MKKLEGNTATMVLSNNWSITIKIIDEDTLQYQYNGGNDDSINETNIFFAEDDAEALEEDSELIACFETKEGERYYLNEFLRDNF
jgi:hypothetical protein